MRLMRVGPEGEAKPVVLHSDGTMRDISGLVGNLSGNSLSLETMDAIRNSDLGNLPTVPEGGRIGACLADVPNFHCVGLNYVNHAKETGAEIPEEPILFWKATSALSGPFDQIPTPKGSDKLDYEVELGIVIGRECSYVSEADALDYVTGYCTINDISERTFQTARGGLWGKGKSAPGFGPIGPQLVTADEAGDVMNLRVTTKVNGETRQDSNTSDMIFSVPHIISYMSQFMTLRVGDVIATGTPEGVAMGMTPPGWLVPGDVVEVEVEGLGAQRSEVVAFSG